MPVPTSINDLSTTANSNSPPGTEAPTLTDDYLRVYASYIAALRDVVLSGTGNLSTANLTYSGTLTGSTGVLNIGAGQIYKDASGNVGFGTTSPAQKLHVVGSVQLSSGSNLQWTAYSAGVSGELFYGTAASGLVGITAGVERMRIDSSGNVGIGTTASFPSGGGLTIYNVSAARVNLKNGTTGSGASAGGGLAYVNTDFTIENRESGAVIVTTLNTERMRIDSSGNVGIGMSSFGASAAGVLALVNATAPSSSPAGGGQLYVEGGALKFRGSGGTITTIAAA